MLVAHGFVSRTIRALARQDFSDFFDWQLGNGELLKLMLLDRLPVRLGQMESTMRNL
ncbi:hypothetical protein [Comamonas endophytica]|uniref:Uncharacterized protein n=1 Tax=Comamonas endophytica TaxID=2949090 RepID=A0ABY6GFS1_9BURK|nr:MULTISPECIES: hypothetical protein [unclassified Acidovorax]MCD2513356.1 hypothetical protein [Acidovorax sp. D4N7]UYG53859.1 hypothetical protein M9799_18170 [Acidovorax sp. 5MLIR]